MPINLLFGKPGRISLGLALAVLLVNSVASWWSIDNLSDHDAWVAHTHEVLSELKALLPTLARANEAHLPPAPFPQQRLPLLLTPDQAMVRAEEAVKRLQTLTEDNQRQQQRLTQFRSLVADHFRADAPPPTLLRHKEWLAQAKRLLDEMEAEEHGLLRQRDRQALASRRVALLTQALTTALAVGVLGAVVWLARRDARNQRRVEQTMRQLNADLERRVVDRTRELAEVNEGLRRAKDEAETSQRRARLIVESAYDAYVAMSRDGVIIDWNQQAENSFGWPRGEAIGRPLHELIIPPRFREAHARGLRRFLETGEGSVIQKRIEVPALHRDGREFPVELTISPLRLGDEWIFSAFLHDISERQRSAEELHRAKETAEAANRSKSEFLANMSHEIRTPMNGILGMTEIVLDTDLSGEQREYIGTVQASAQSLLTIINDILDFSKIEAGKMELAPEPFVLREQLGDTLKPLAVRAHKKGVELACRVAPDVPETLIADWNRLQQVLVNLVGNAVKFTSAGEIVVDVRMQGSDCGQADPRPLTPDPCLLHFSVRDTGLGIAADKRDAIFAPFEQADGSMTRRFGGTGLGLSISRRLVELMGGRIWVESEVGRGSTFHFTARLATAEAEAPNYAGLARLLVLIVDDSLTSRDIVQEMLASWGMRPTVVGTVPEARLVLDDAARRREPFHVLLLDAELPPEGMRALVQQADLPRGRAPILLLPSSAYRAGDRPDVGKDFRRVAKPIKPSDLLEAIQQSMGENLAIAAAPTAAPDEESAGSLPPLRILLAEDNVVNQRVGVLMLEKHGHTVVLANNGHEALEALASASFDMVLMDVQMPEMDGLEAVAELRRREAEAGGHQPVIALTAHAMKGDREHCLAAGMDGYASKPLQAPNLLRVIREVLSVAAPPVAPSRRSSARLDRTAILKRLGGDAAALRELAALFRQDAVSLLNDIEDALGQGNAKRLRRSAHSLRGSASLFGADEVSATAAELEQVGQSGDTTAGRAVAARLSPQVEELCSALASLEAED